MDGLQIDEEMIESAAKAVNRQEISNTNNGGDGNDSETTKRCVRHMQHEMGGLRKHKSQRRYMYHFHVCRGDRLPWHAGLYERTDVAVHMTCM